MKIKLIAILLTILMEAGAVLYVLFIEDLIIKILMIIVILMAGDFYKAMKLCLTELFASYKEE